MILYTDRLCNKFYPYIPSKWNKPDLIAMEIYICLKNMCANQGGECQITTSRVARRFRCCNRTASNKLKKLSDVGLIKRTYCIHKGKYTNKISILKIL